MPPSLGGHASSSGQVQLLITEVSSNPEHAAQCLHVGAQGRQLCVLDIAALDPANPRLGDIHGSRDVLLPAHRALPHRPQPVSTSLLIVIPPPQRCPPR